MVLAQTENDGEVKYDRALRWDRTVTNSAYIDHYTSMVIMSSASNTSAEVRRPTVEITRGPF